MEHRIRVLLADDQSILADGIRSVLSSSGELEVVGILRPKENVTGVLDTGLAYTPALTEYVLEKNLEEDNRAIVEAAVNSEKGSVRPAFFSSQARSVSAASGAP